MRREGTLDTASGPPSYQKHPLSHFRTPPDLTRTKYENKRTLCPPERNLDPKRIQYIKSPKGTCISLINQHPAPRKSGRFVELHDDETDETIRRKIRPKFVRWQKGRYIFPPVKVDDVHGVLVRIDAITDDEPAQKT
uniref:Uncharacterized protein n=1 Tax=Lygus hesperus TaxID=30085 RepID=A0A0K8T3L6_LYGHE